MALVVIDEAVAELDSALAYVVSAVVIAEDADATRDRLRQILQRHRRSRPLHWHAEGPSARLALREVVDTSVIVGEAFAAPCGRRGQERARQACLSQAWSWAAQEGGRGFIIESRGGSADLHDRRSWRTFASALEGGELSASWRTKREPLLWLADGLASAVRERLVHHERCSEESLLLISAMGASGPRWCAA